MSLSDPVPLPGPDQVDPELPGYDEVRITAGAIATAAAPDGGLTELQEVLLAAQCEAMTDFAYDRAWNTHIGPDELARALARRNWVDRVRILQEIILIALVIDPTPPEVGRRIAGYAHALGVGDTIINQIQKYGPESYDAAIIDFARNGYAGNFAKRSRPVLHTDRDIGSGWGAVEDDPELAAKWSDLVNCPTGSLGRDVHDFYRSRGFAFPGLPGSAPPLLAQHDWVHVLADYGTTLENELEVFGFIARADDDPRGFSLLAMVIGLFETGVVRDAAGLFTADTGHLSMEGMAARLADAHRRGALAKPDGQTPKAFLAVDWFRYAHLPVTEVAARFHIPDKSAKAVAAGSVGPWHTDGISEYQRSVGDPATLARITSSQ